MCFAVVFIFGFVVAIFLHVVNLPHPYLHVNSACSLPGKRSFFASFVSFGCFSDLCNLYVCFICGGF